MIVGVITVTCLLAISMAGMEWESKVRFSAEWFWAILSSSALNSLHWFVILPGPGLVLLCHHGLLRQLHCGNHHTSHSREASQRIFQLPRSESNANMFYKCANDISPFLIASPITLPYVPHKVSQFVPNSWNFCGKLCARLAWTRGQFLWHVFDLLPLSYRHPCGG